MKMKGHQFSRVVILIQRISVLNTSDRNRTEILSNVFRSEAFRSISAEAFQSEVFGRSISVNPKVFRSLKN